MTFMASLRRNGKRVDFTTLFIFLSDRCYSECDICQQHHRTGLERTRQAEKQGFGTTILNAAQALDDVIGIHCAD